MVKKIIYNETFWVSGIMCHKGCGSMIQDMLSTALAELKGLPEDVQLSLDYQPRSFGTNRILGVQIIVESARECDLKKTHALLSETFKESIPFPIIDLKNTEQKNLHDWSNWINIAINAAAIIAIITLWAVFPPSLPLTIGLISLSFITTAFTARKYLFDFFKNLYNKTITMMPTAITLGWFLSLAHSLYHSITMPLSSSGSMMFMSYIMPLMLITIVNGMDELKAQIMHKSSKMQLQGLKALFPEMAAEYPCYNLSKEQKAYLSELKEEEQLTHFLKKVLADKEAELINKSVLKENMIIQVRRGQCFPVDGFILQGNTSIDSSILTGKFHESKQVLDFVPAGSINLGQDVIIRAIKSVHDSTINQTLLVANRELDPVDLQSQQKFTYIYTGLIIASIALAVIVPVAFGIFTLPLLLQNLSGILFSICPCTLGIAHELPQLLSMHQRHKHGTIIRGENLIQDTAIDIIVFDKTGTLTTGDSEVESYIGLDNCPGLWGRIYLLEKHQGGEHPLAKAITKHCAKYGKPLIQNIHSASTDPQHCGLSAVVQGLAVSIGSADYFNRNKITLPQDLELLIRNKTDQGYTPVYVAENRKYQGVIFIKHSLRKGIIGQLQQLHQQGKKLIMLTGDSESSALGFSKQFGPIFESIQADQKPESKEAFIENLLKENTSKKVWFIGDGLNDVRCARKTTELGGVSCSMNSTDKAAFFTDISLNGSLKYLFKHKQLNQFDKKIIKQNQGIMVYSTLIFLAFIITFSITGIAVSPLIPMLIMAATTSFILFNTYRAKLSVDVALDKAPSLLKQALTSDFSLALLILGSSLLIAAILVATVATGGLALPLITFTSGIAMAISSGLLLSATGMLATFALVWGSQIIAENCLKPTLGVIDKLDSHTIKSKPVFEAVETIPELSGMDLMPEFKFR